MSDISIIGGIAINIEGNTYGQLIHGDYNSGKITMSCGGAGRNIAENLARMGASVNFISIAGDDFAGRGAVRELKELGVKVDNIKLLSGENTAVQMSALDILGDMEMGLCDLEIMEKISQDMIDEVFDNIKDSKMIGIDTNLTKETLDYATKKLEGIPIFLDPVSATKAEKARDIIGRFHTIKPNRMEAEILSGLSILSEEELEKAGQWFIDEGVKRVFISLGAGGIYYKDSMESGIIRPEEISAVSKTGAGESFSAAIMYAHLKGYDVKNSAECGMAAASITLKTKNAASLEMSEINMKEAIQMRFKSE